MRIRTLFILCVLLGLTSLAAQAYRPQFKDAQGTVRTYKSNMHMKGTSDVMGMTIPVDSTVTMTSLEKVLAKNAAAASTLSYTVKEGKVKATVSVPGLDEDETVDQALPSFNMTYTRTPSGRVTSVKSTGQLDPNMGQMTPIDIMSDYPGQGLEFPNKELKVGDTWDGVQSFTLAGGATVHFKVKYTLTGVKDVNGASCLLVTSDINVKANNLAVQLTGIGGNAAKVTVSMVITGTETMLFDQTAGEIAGTDSDLNIDVNMTSDSGEVPNIKMKLKMDGDMTRQ